MAHPREGARAGYCDEVTQIIALSLGWAAFAIEFSVLIWLLARHNR